MVEIKFDVPEELRRRFKAYAVSKGKRYEGALEELLDIAEKAKVDKA